MRQVKVVIFARFTEIEAIKGVMEKQGVGYEWITGAAPMEERGDRVRKFQTTQVRCFWRDTNAGLGITLTAAHRNLTV